MSTQQTRLTDQGMVQVLSLLKDTDGVELRVTVPDADRHSAVLELDLDVLDCDLRQAVFFDTPDLHLSRAGAIRPTLQVRPCVSLSSIVDTCSR